MALPEGERASARTPSWCQSCRSSIIPGDPIIRSGTVGWVHEACYPGVVGPMAEAVRAVDLKVGIVNEKVDDVVWRLDELFDRLQRLEDEAPS